MTRGASLRYPKGRDVKSCPHRHLSQWESFARGCCQGIKEIESWWWLRTSPMVLHIRSPGPPRLTTRSPGSGLSQRLHPNHDHALNAGREPLPRLTGRGPAANDYGCSVSAVTDRRTVLLDAALEIVGTEGMRGLTHRAVDAAAAVPAGSTSNYFRTREALILGIVERFIARERAMATGPHDEVDPSPDGVATAFGRFAHRALGPDRAVTLARYAILVETAQNPDLREGMARGADQVDRWALDVITRAGSQHPERDLGVLANYVTGLVLHELALPSPDLDAAARIRALIDTLGWKSPSTP